MGCISTGNRIFNDQAFLRSDSQHRCCFDENFRIRFGFGDVVAVRNRIKVGGKTDPFQDERSVLGRRTDCQLIASCTKFIQAVFHFIGQISRRHSGQKFAIDIVLLCCQLFLACIAQLFITTLQNDLQRRHTGNTAKAIVDFFIKIYTDSICHFFPCQIMVFIGEADHAVQIKNHSFKFFCHRYARPFRIHFPLL